MSITPSSLGSIAGLASTTFAPAAAPTGDFAGTLGSAIQQVNNLQATAEQKVTDLIAGKGQDIHAATLSVEHATLAFDLMLQVRNKVISAYQEISRLQF
ncbi:MAG TPA: flagellar hook-basal body complex protein FliE [Candidatus Saccharimonadales bacterium]|nr:flagellar hook-basal body complex protein FliE [Candidatus Saccharimonadales bacterium]